MVDKNRSYGTRTGFASCYKLDKKAAEVEESVEICRLVRKHKSKRFFPRRYFRNRALIEFVLRIGDNLMPVTKTMTIRQAGIANKKYDNEFLDGKTPRLYHWQPFDYEKLQADSRAFYSYCTDFGRRDMERVLKSMGYEVAEYD